jgi:flagellar basal-body rod modification protein FlgD
MTTIAAAASASSQAAKSSDRSQIAGNFDQFLQLLTTQLRNQDPTAPLDTNQFTQQLVQFAQVEQQLKQNETLTAMLTANKTTTAANAMGFVGARVTTDGRASTLANNRAEWRLEAPRGGTATITIRDANNAVVGTQNVTLTAGEQGYRWDGRTSTGQAAPEGEYNIVIDAFDAQRNRMTVNTNVTGVVDSVDLSGDAPVLIMGSVRTTLDKVKSVSRP